MVCLPFHHFRFRINNLDENKKSAKSEPISHLIRYLASLEDFCMRFCMHLLHRNPPTRPPIEQVQRIFVPDWTGF